MRWPLIVVKQAKKNNEFEEVRKRGNLNSQALTLKKMCGSDQFLVMRISLQDRISEAVPMQTNPLVVRSHAKLTIAEPYIV